MTPFQFTFNSTDISITSLEVGRWIGYPEKEIPPAIEKQIDAVCFELFNLLDIRGGFYISDNIAIGSASLYIDNTEFYTKKIITRSLKEASSIAIFACTIGEAISNRAIQLIREDALKGYIGDVVASIMAEKTAGKFQEKIEQYAHSQEDSISNRYSPGYCGWSVAEQHLLFSLLPDSFCGITLNDAALMQPIKSVSGIIGIGKKIIKNPYECNICDETDCIMSAVS